LFKISNPCFFIPCYCYFSFFTKLNAWEENEPNSPTANLNSFCGCRIRSFDGSGSQVPVRRDPVSVSFTQNPCNIFPTAHLYAIIFPCTLVTTSMPNFCTHLLFVGLQVFTYWSHRHLSGVTLYWATCTLDTNKVLRHVIFSNVLLLNSFDIQILSWKLCQETLSIYVLFRFSIEYLFQVARI
jgi:hypothetical protein